MEKDEKASATISQRNDAPPGGFGSKAVSKDEYDLAQLGYKQGVHAVFTGWQLLTLQKSSFAHWASLKTGLLHLLFATYLALTLQ
jgi:hypothetical protein